MNSHDAAVGDVEFAVEVERPGIGVRAVLRDLAVVDVAGELGGVLVLFVLGLERADAARSFSLRMRRRTFTCSITLIQSPA